MRSGGGGGDRWRGVTPTMLLWWDESCFLIVAARVRVLGKEEEERRVSTSLTVARLSVMETANSGETSWEFACY